MARFVRANRIRFALRTWEPDVRDAPLALCLHGFPDHAPTFRHLGPALAAAGYRVAAPWMRGYAPTAVPEDGRYGPDVLAADANALHRALGGDERAVLVGHDWGAVAGYRAVAAAPQRWSALVTMAVPPEPALRGARTDPGQVKRSWYAGALALPGGRALLERDGFALVDRLWRDWSPGYDVSDEELGPLKASLASPGSGEAAVGYYRAARRWFVTGRSIPGDNVPRVPTLYLHGSEDGCIGVAYARRAREHLPTGSQVEIVGDAGHFLHLERPGHVAELVTGFLAATPGSGEPRQ